ncbi:cyclic peptide export ABC transporter [Methylocaldum gracile]|jgi:putative ATP-binding cassette transporter|uniref:cyclic peptide export ABC transporter n=1 Tax=unclassified Methylocaldum TaxID=2622260 RepID=UPI00105E3D31
MSDLFGFLSFRSWIALLIAALTGMVSGLSGVALLAVINGALQPPASIDEYWPVFVGLCGSFIAARLVSEYVVIFLGQNTIRDLRIRLCREILELPLAEFQKMGPGKALANLTEDVAAVSEAFTRIPSICVNIAVVFGGLGYLGWLSRDILWIVLGAMAVGVLSFRTIQYWAYRWLVVAREHEDSVYRYIRNMTDGIKELKLNQPRRRAFLSDCVEASIINCRRNRLSAMLWYAVAINWGNGLFYAVIGTILFILPQWQEIPSEIARGYCLIILYMAMPLQLLLEVIPILSKARVSAGKIHALEKGLSGKNQDYGLLPRRDPETRTPILELSKVQHCYRGEDGRVEFVLGPIDLTLYPGEIVFIIGGNGSGKSTLAFLLVGLYRPESGEIQLDGEPINDGNLEYYRQHFSAIFFDFFLFENLLGFDNLESNSKIWEYLKHLDLAHKVTVKDGKFSTVNLSQGQRKRLALLVAYLEDRPFYVFDEWAADQDPIFKRIFYREILGSLKSRGKTVIVITHDDAYFSLADRCLKLRDGKLFEVPVAKASDSHGRAENFAAPTTTMLEVGHGA